MPMTERPPDDDELARERRESNDLGYRDTKEEHAYEEAAAKDEADDDDDQEDR